MRNECLNHKYVHDELLPITRLITNIGNKMQICTQRYDRRPYGVGLLVSGYDVSLVVIIITVQSDSVKVLYTLLRDDLPFYCKYEIKLLVSEILFVRD